MVAPVNRLVRELNTIDGVDAEQCGGPNVNVSKTTAIKYTVLIEFTEPSERAEDEVHTLVANEPHVVDVQDDETWGADTWALIVSNRGGKTKDELHDV